jgi:hypothetical protein
MFPGIDGFVRDVEAENRKLFPNPPSASKRDKALLRARIERWRRKLNDDERRR